MQMKQRTQWGSEQKTRALTTILIAGLISGMLDSIAASVVFYLKFGLNPAQVMQFIASALYGPAAFSGGLITVIVGVLLHFSIAFAITAIYFYFYPKIGELGKWPILSGLALGIGIWSVMNVVVIPFSKIQSPPFEISAVIISITWHMLLVGLPISFIVKRHFINTPLY
jgi:hypothetical protein